MNEQVSHQLTRARTALILNQPFVGQLALRLRLVERKSIGTLAVDGRSVFYNPEFVASLTPSLTRSAIAHEVFHCVFDHISRTDGRNARRWNQAGDYVINDTLKQAGFEIGAGWLWDIKYRGMSTDAIYNALPESGTDDDDDMGDGEGDPLDEIMEGDPETREQDSTDWKIATIQAATSAKASGSLPASMQRFIDELVNPQVDWRALLRRFVTETSKDDYSWQRQNRRFVGQGFYLPTLYSESMGAVVVAIDTSGSITPAMINAFGAEIKSLVQSSRPSTTTVVYCDSGINHVDTFEVNDEMSFKIHGGGGTDFRPPFSFVEQNNLNPVCFIYLTDGYGPFPDDPGYPVLWCCTTDVVAPFGETVPIRI